VQQSEKERTIVRDGARAPEESVSIDGSFVGNTTDVVFISRVGADDALLVTKIRQVECWGGEAHIPRRECRGHCSLESVRIALERVTQ
jgi:hypothetical protein